MPERARTTSHRDPVDGWLILDKPPGMSSAAAVGAARRLLQARKAGHAGTLDPFASGMLPIAFGEATKTVQHVVAGSKQYRFTVAWGEARDTDDCTGRVVRMSARRPKPRDIEDCLSAFRGEILQRPPSYSALHSGGKRAYALARRGEQPKLEPRRVTVCRIELLASEPDLGEFEMTCGKGTYVRSLARDIGEALGCLGHVRELRRLRVAPFDAATLVPLAKLEQIPHTDTRRKLLLPIAAGLADIPVLAVTGEEARRIAQGRAIPVARHPEMNLGDRKVWACLGSRPVAVGVVSEGAFRPSRVLQPPQPRA